MLPLMFIFWRSFSIALNFPFWFEDAAIFFRSWNTTTAVHVFPVRFVLFNIVTLTYNNICHSLTSNCEQTDTENSLKLYLYKKNLQLTYTVRRQLSIYMSSIALSHSYRNPMMLDSIYSCSTFMRYKVCRTHLCLHLCSAHEQIAAYRGPSPIMLTAS